MVHEAKEVGVVLREIDDIAVEPSAVGALVRCADRGLCEAVFRVNMAELGALDHLRAHPKTGAHEAECDTVALAGLFTGKKRSVDSRHKAHCNGNIAGAHEGQCGGVVPFVN